MSVQTSIERINAIKARMRTNLAAQGITVPEDTVLSEMAERILSVAGEDGRGIVSMTRTSGTGESGSTDTYTITYTDETTNTFSVYNGKDGKSDMDWIPTKDWDEGSTLYEDVLSFTGSMATIPSGRTFSIQPAINYRVYWNGVIYECTGKTYDDQPYLGNGRLVHGNAVEDTGEPFGFIAKIFGYDAVYVNKSVSAPEDITVKITTGVYTYNTMPDEYLPGSVVKSVNGLAPDENGNVATGSTGGEGLPTLRIYAVKSGAVYKQEIVEGGATQIYTAEQIHEIAKERVVTIVTYTSRDSFVGKGIHRYFTTNFAEDGTVMSVYFRGVYANASSKLVPAYVSVNNMGNMAVVDEKWAGSSVETDTSLTKSSFPADAKIVGNRLTDLSEQIANMGSGGGGGTSIDVTASVGQTIVVKEVDANGKPTAWEAVDHQPRTHWLETTEIMPETTIEIDPEGGSGVALVDFALEPNKAYTIKYNGVEYAGCVGMELEGLMFGNLGVFDESLPVTEHPFILASMVGDMDEDGNTDYGIAVIPLDGAESVTVSISEETVHKIPEEYTPTPYYVYEINKDAFERNGSSDRTYYLAFVTEMPVSLLEAMYLRKPVYLRVIDGTGAYMVPAQYCGQIDAAWLVADKTQDTVSFQGDLATTAIRISAHISDAYQSFSEYYIRFQGEM